MVDSEGSGLGGIAGIGIVAMVMFLIFALLMGNGGLFGGFRGGNGGGSGADAAIAAMAMANANRYQPQYATQDFVQQSNNFASLVDQNRDITATINGGTAQTVAAVNQAKYDNISVAKDIENLLLGQIGEIKVGQSEALANQNRCCCETKQLISETGAGINAQIAQNRYEAAMNTASINANTTAQTQKILDKLCESETRALQNRVNQLELQVATSGMFRAGTTIPVMPQMPFPPFNPAQSFVA